MSSEYISLFMFLAVIISILAGFPVAFSLLGVSLLFGVYAFGDAVAAMLIRRIFNTAGNYVLAAVPFFVFMGVMMERAGMAENIFHAIRMWIGKLRGGLGVTTILLATVIAASSGIIGASELIVGLLALPIMLKYNYQKELATGAIIAGGALGTLIPPSVVTVVYGPTAGVSVARLLIATILPGLLLSTIYNLYILIRCYLNPNLGPPAPIEEKISLAQKLSFTARAFVPPIFLILAVLGSIIFGLAAPTEAAAMGAFGSGLLALAYRKLNWTMLKEVVYETLKLTSMIMVILAAGSAYTGVFLGAGGGEALEKILLSLNLGRWGILAIFMLTLFLAGFLLDWASIILIFVPVFAPIIVKLGFDPIWFGVLVIMMIQTSYLTPPMAPGIFYLKGIAPPEIKEHHIYRGIIAFTCLQLLAIVLVILFPQIALWLPNKIIGVGK